nr:MAG TPA: hypothetical protein [Caudoviricetes sp.]
MLSASFFVYRPLSFTYDGGFYWPPVSRARWPNDAQTRSA